MRVISACCGFLCFSSSLFSTTATWNLNANGNWNVNANWTPATFPNAIDDTANFGNVITANRVISLGAAAQNITIGTVTFDDNNNYTIQSGLAGNNLIFDVSSGLAHLTLTSVNGSGAHSITSPVTLNDTLQMSHSSTANFTISGIMGGTGGLTKIGTGTGALVLNAANNYGGPTSIQEGFLNYNVDGSIPASSAVTVGDGLAPAATLRIVGVMTQVNALNMTINSDGTLIQNSGATTYLSSLQGSGAITLSTGTTAANLFDISLSSNQMFSGAIGGGAASGSTSPEAANRLTKEGTATLTLTGTSSYSSRTFVANGVVDVQTAAALGIPGANSAVYVRSTGGNAGSLYLENSITLSKNLFLNGNGFSGTGALRNLNGSNTILGNIAIGWAGGTETASDATIQVDMGTTLTCNGVISGANNLSKTNPGTLIYTGGSNNTMTGMTTINAGLLQLNKTAGINALAGNATINATGSLQLAAINQIVNTAVITLAGGTFDLAGNTDTIGSLIFNSGTLSQGGATLTLASTAATALSMGDGTTITDPLAFSAAGGVTYTGTTTRATVSGSISIGTTAHVFNIANGTDLVDMELSGAITGTTGTVTMSTGTGTLRFSGSSANTYTGLTTINAGELQLNKTGVSALNGSVTINTGGTVTLLASDQIVNTATLTVSGGTFNMNGFSETATRLVYSSGTVTQGGGTLSLNATSGTAITMGDGTTLPGPVMLTGAAGTPGITYNGTTTTATISGNLDLGSQTRTFNIAAGTATNDLVISGLISGIGGITMSTGTGQMAFTGSTSNTYSGTTTISSGTLLLNNSSGQGIVGNIALNNAAGTLVLGNSNQIGTTSNMTLSGGTFNMAGFSTSMGSLTYQSGTFTQGGGTLTLAGAGTALTLRNTTISGPLVLSGGGGIVFDSTNNGTGTISNTLNLGGNTTTFNIQMGTAATDMLVSGVISNGGVSKVGNGQLEFSGASPNTYTGLTTISAGTLFLNKPSGVNAIAGDVQASGGTLTLGALQEIADTSNLTLSGGTFNMAGFNETLNSLTFNSGTFTQAGGVITLASNLTALSMRNTTISGNVVLSGGGAVVFDATSNGTATLSGTVDMGGFTTSFNVNMGTATNDMTVSGVLADGGVTKTGAGRLQFSGGSPNTYTGLTTVSTGILFANKTAGVTSIPGNALINGGILTSNTANQFATSSAVTLSSGTWDLSGQPQSIDSLTFQAGTLTQSGAAVLTLNNATTSLTLRNTTVPGPLVLSGGGAVVFDPTNGGTAILSGTVNLSAHTISFNIPTGGSSPDLSVNGAISNGAVSKINTGVLQFDGTSANTYTGLTTVSAGTLLLNKTAGVTALAADGAISGGTLTFGAANQIATTSTITLSSGTFDLAGFAQTMGMLNFQGGTYSDGGGTLTLSSGVTALSQRNTALSGAVVLSGGGAVVFDNTNNGTATLSGTLDLGGATIPFNIADGTAPIDMQVNSVISNGSLTKLGSGTLVLAGANTYGGGSLISAGTLQGDATSLQGNITDNGALVFDQGGAGTYLGMISGTGTFDKQGSGTLTLTNTNSIGGLASVSQGTLIVNGSFGGGGPMSVAPGALLKGTGTITKDLTLSGTINPGNSIGTLHLVGNQIFATGSTLEIEVNPTTSDLLDITGTLAIQPGATLSLQPVAGAYAPLTDYTLIQTTGGLTGTFSTVTNNFPLFRPTLIYTPFDLLLEVTALPFSDLINGGNAGKVAACLDSLSTSTCSNMHENIRNLQMITSVEALKEALLQLQPSAFTSLAVVQENALLYLTQAIEQRLEANWHTCCPAFLSKNGEAALWLTVLGAHTSQHNQGGEPGYLANSPGMIVGVDSLFTDQLRLGVGFGYTHTHLHWMQNRGTADMETLYWTLYGNWESSHFYCDTTLIGGYNFYEIDRTIDFTSHTRVQETASSDHNGMEGDAHLQLGGIWGCRGLVFSPFVSIDYLYLHENSFKEHGARSFNLHVRGKNSSLLVSAAGLDFSHCFRASESSYTPYLQLSLIRETRFQGGTERASFECGCEMTVKGLYPSRTLGSIQAGLNAEIDRHAFSLFYQGKYSSHYQDNAFYLRYLFGF